MRSNGTRDWARFLDPAIVTHVDDCMRKMNTVAHRDHSIWGESSQRIARSEAQSGVPGRNHMDA